MKMSMPITKERIKHHFNYAWWQYALLLIVAILGWNLIHTMTHYRSPEHLKVDWFYGAYLMDNGEKAEAFADQLHKEVLPEMEEVNFQSFISDDTYTPMQLTAWTFAGEGDLYTLPEQHFRNLSTSGVLMNLQPHVESGLLPVEGVDLSGCTVKHPETGEEWLVGIPMSCMPGLQQHGLFGDDAYFCVLYAGGNDDNTLKLLAHLLENYREPAPLPAT